jgi:hypothetical protein
MRATAGRLVFFDKLAEGLQTAVYRGISQRVALAGSSILLPDADILSLARAVCRQHRPDLEDIPEFRWPWEQELVGLPAVVLNAGGRRLQDCVTKIGADEYPEVLVIINFDDDAVEFPRLLYDPRGQSDLVSDALNLLFLRCGKQSSALARVRFEENGFDALRGFDLFDDPTSPDWSDSDILELYYHRISRLWTYRGYPVAAEKIRNWVSQFASAGFSEEAHHLLTYLQQYGFVTETSVVEGLVKQFLSVDTSGVSNVVAVSIQKPGKSEQKLAYRLKPFISLQPLAEALPLVRGGTPEEPTFLFCFDDCIGSGDSIESYLFDPAHNPHREDLVLSFREGRARIFVVAFHADIRAVSRLEGLSDAFQRLKVLPVRIVDDSHRAFSPRSRIFPDHSRRNEFMKFCHRIGEDLLPGSPLGWNDCQWVIAYDYSIPDNSLPVLHGSSNVDRIWRPLFERAR